MSSLTSVQVDRAVGSVLASAAGDALGSQYEFGPSFDDDVVPEFGIGYFGHGVGEWTDDTSMAMPILQQLAQGQRLEDPGTLAAIVEGWLQWSHTSRDVGAQTRALLGRLVAGSITEESARAASESLHAQHGRSGGNGSLMRTGPVALGYLDRSPAELAAAAGRVAKLTHWEDDNADACALWCLAIRQAILTGEVDVRAQLEWISAERRERWMRLIEDAEGKHPRDLSQDNGWVVRAFQAALAAVSGSTSLADALERAVRGGNDTDTIAAIAGSLAGARYGASAVPAGWRDVVHGWPDLRAADLERLALSALAMQNLISTNHEGP